MKKIIAGLLLAISSVAYSQEAFTGANDIRAYVGANIQSKGTGVTAGADYGLGRSFSVGLQMSYLLGTKHNVNGVEKAPVGDRFDLRGRFNANLGGVMNLPEQLRYFFNKGFGVFSEITFPIARYKTGAAGYEKLNNQFTFQIGAAFDLN